MHTPRMAKADFITAILLVGLGVGSLIASLRMPRYETSEINPYTVPGIVPGLLAAVILLLGMVLLVRAVRRGGWRLDIVGTAAALIGPEARRLYLVVGLTLGYAAGLVGRVPFWLATAAFIFLFISAFEYSDTDRRARMLVVAAILAVIASAAVVVVFEQLFLVRLP